MQFLSTISQRILIFGSSLSILVALFALISPQMAYANVPTPPNSAGYIAQGARGEYREAAVGVVVPTLSAGSPTITMSGSLGGVDQGLVQVTTELISSIGSGGTQSNGVWWSETINKQPQGGPGAGYLDGPITINAGDIVWLYVSSNAHFTPGSGPNSPSYNGFQAKDMNSNVEVQHNTTDVASDSGGVSATLAYSGPLRSNPPQLGFNYVNFYGFEVEDYAGGNTSSSNPTVSGKWLSANNLPTPAQAIQNNGIPATTSNMDPTGDFTVTSQ